MEAGQEAEARSSWGGKLEFILTLVGYAVGLGNVWRFPYLTYRNGGGAFLIPYFLCLICIGMPMFYLEIVFGQFASLGPLAIWSINPLMKGVGMAMVIVSLYIVVYYNVIVSWCLYYLFSSMQDPLPWVSCNNTWNTPQCVEAGAANISANETVITSSEEFFYRHVLDISDSINEPGVVRWQLALCLLLGWVIIFLVILKGIDSLGKVAYVVAPFPYILLTIMLIRGVTLDGSTEGIIYYIRPVFSKLGESGPWVDAAVQIFYSLGIGNGGLIAMASFNKFNNKSNRDGVMIPIINCCTSVYAGFVIFSVLGYMAKLKNVDIDDVATDGPGLVFTVYPEALATMPVAPLWSVLFFLMMTMLGLNPQFSTLESVISAIIDEFPDFLRVGLRPMMLRAAFCICGFLLGLPMITQGGFYLFTIMDTYAVGYPVLVMCILYVVVIQFIYGYTKFADDVEMMLGSRPSIFWRATWCCISPLFLMVILILQAIYDAPLEFMGVPYPSWTSILSWLIVGFPLLVIFVWAFAHYCNNGGWQLLKQTTQSSPEWGPALTVNRTGRYRLIDEELKAEDVTSQEMNNISVVQHTYVNTAYEKDNIAKIDQNNI